jgi:hypothetical protein
VSDICEGDTNFLCVLKWVSLEDLGFREPKLSKCPKLSMQALFILSVRRCLRSEQHRLERRRSLCELVKTYFALYKHHVTRTNFLEVYDKWACASWILCHSIKFQPSLILRIGKIAHVFQKLVPHTLNGITCVNMSTKTGYLRLIYHTSWSTTYAMYTYMALYSELWMFHVECNIR